MSILPKISPNVYPLRVQSGNYFHLDMQDIGNKLIDHSEKSNHCIPYGAIPVAGRNGWARYFDGIDDYILDGYGRKILREGTLGKWESIEIGEVTKIVGTGTKLYLNDGNTLPPKFTGKLVSDFAQYCTALIDFGCHINQFSGVLPSFANCTALQYFGCHNNQFSGVLPSFADCTALVNFSCYNNQFSGYTAESFKTQKYLHICYMNNNAISNAADINQILADLRYSKDNITDRVNCVVKLEDGTNAAPTGQGITDKDYLNNNGWTVTTN